MPKAYDPKPENSELFLKLGDAGSGVVYVDLVDRAGVPCGVILAIGDDGVQALPRVPADVAARAGLANAIDSNSRLKVIGQEVEAEKMPEAVYPAALQHGTGDLTVDSHPDGCVTFKVRTGGGPGVEVTSLNIGGLRALRDRINRHLAYVEKEGLG